jgi:hypothetical protein
MARERERVERGRHREISRERQTEKQRESDRDHPQNFVLTLNFQFFHEECSHFPDRDTLQEKSFGQNCFDVFDTFFFVLWKSVEYRVLRVEVF